MAKPPWRAPMVNKPRRLVSATIAAGQRAVSLAVLRLGVVTTDI
jgi:hypothetical protein